MVPDSEKCTEKLVRHAVSYTCMLYAEVGITLWKNNDCE